MKKLPSSSKGAPLRSAGFSILELLVVLVILGLLAGTLAPLYSSRIESARETRCKQDLKVVADAFHLYFEDTRRWPHDLDLAPTAINNQVLDLRLFLCMYSNAHAKPAWEGPYLGQGFKPAGATATQVCGANPDEGFQDPWDRPYQVVYAQIGSTDAPFGAVAIVSRGANGNVETSLGQLMNGTTGGDDVALVITNRL